MTGRILPQLNASCRCSTHDLKNLFLGREVAHVPQSKAFPVQSPDATIAVPPGNPRTMGQLVHRLPVGPGSIDLATHDLESVC